MNYKNLFKKGQSLPLNTIVIAILVIIVLLVIIVFFTTQLGESGDAIDDQSVSKCDLNNPSLATLGYSAARPRAEDETCEDAGYEGYTDSRIVSNCCVKK